jgi:trigger factor
VKVNIEKTENSQAFLRVEMESAEVEKALEEAYRRLVMRANIPGFRKGKAPRVILERYIGKESLLEDALNHLLPQACERAIKEQGIDAFARPSIEIEQTEPVVFRATVPLQPQVKLGDYHQVKLTPAPVTLKEDDVDTLIAQLRRQHGTWEPVERAVKSDDLVTLDIESSIDGKPFLNQQGVQYEVLPDRPVPIAGFAGQLVGMQWGEEKEFQLRLPKDYPRAELAEKEAQFKVRVSEIKQLQLPKLNSEFARLVNPELKTMASLRKRVSTNLQLRAEEKAREEFEERVIEAVVGVSQAEFPPVLVDVEIDQLLDQQARWLQASGGLEEYLRQTKKTGEELREELRPSAIKKVTRSLVLEKIAGEEKIEASDAEVTAELEKLAKTTTGNKGEVRGFLESPQARHSVEQAIIRHKTIERLVKIAGGSPANLGGENQPKNDKIVKEEG